MNTFKIGEIVIAVNDPANTTDPSLYQYDGQTCEVVGDLGVYEIDSGVTVGYNCFMQDGEEIIFAPHELRKIPPAGVESPSEAVEIAS